MLYLESIVFPDPDREFDFLLGQKRTCYDSFYPFKVLSSRGLERLDFEPLTILCGGNGTGKTTALNVIAECLGGERQSAYNKSNFFQDYVDLCRISTRGPAVPCRILTSDDVFDYMLDIRTLNEGIDRKREDLFEEYLDARYSRFQLKSIEDYEHLKKSNLAKSKTQSRFVRHMLMDNAPERSNGESAFLYFTQRIGENGIYLLDEPENSLSPARQMELATFLEDSVRFFGCQFIVSTHSPFLLAMHDAKIYDLDTNPVSVKRWTQLAHVRAYYRFFREHQSELED
ncbi:MAG TPA: AAA family ATPase [Candidatus Pullichristensenella excrementigallinarum]|uniref:AAA family ATPase n=1 Tax=Candidatus Pullichristensenella excrementigallinarum TaxID=2840907 RepID=A0A9D1IB94_9FIRM|nr:AAA family ATPase [Candidatus Pullichristensenella excrementigallinarum]